MGNQFNTSRVVAERFDSFVDRNGPTMPGMETPCWIWTGNCSDTGYGKFKLNGRSRKAHTVAWELSHGARPAGHGVLHRCDNPPCVRGDHLFTGTPADNAADKIAKGRSAQGRRLSETLPHRKLSDEEVLMIRRREARGERQRALAVEFGVTPQAIHHIIHRRSYAWLS